MATSSISKIFTINNHDEAVNLINMFEQFYEKPQEKKEKYILSQEMSQEKMQKIINERLGKTGVNCAK